MVAATPPVPGGDYATATYYSLPRFVHNLTTNNRHDRLEFIDPVVGNCQVVTAQDNHIGELSLFNRTEHVLFADEARCIDRRHTQRLLSIDGLFGPPCALHGIRAGTRTARNESEFSSDESLDAPERWI